MRQVDCSFELATPVAVGRVVSIDELWQVWRPELRFFVRAESNQDRRVLASLRYSGISNVHWVSSDDVVPGDVISPRPSKRQAVVLFRPTDQHHCLLLTNRCNSYCLMCSQPPTPQNDDWLVEEAIDILRHIATSPDVLGLSGGEPLLLGSALRRVLDAINVIHPTTRIEVLTNARLFSRLDLTAALLREDTTNVTWLVPLYGHADYLHDFVVQSPGAYEETLAGLLALQQWRQPIQLRIVLIEPVLKVLPELAGFIGRNLPFVREVALMACEPIGFALANRQQCEVDLMDWSHALQASARTLHRHRVPFLFMNTPLCALPEDLRPMAHRSISDWKNVYGDECERCLEKPNCSGLFAWHKRGWKPTNIKSIQEIHV